MLGPWLSTRLGWIAAFVYCACAALRLARFNTNIDVVDKRFFQGLPSPAAASLVAGLVWAMEQYQVDGAGHALARLGVTMFAGLSMVSNFQFYSGKDINLRKSVSFSLVVGDRAGARVPHRLREHAARDPVPALQRLRAVGLRAVGLGSAQPQRTPARRRRRSLTAACARCAKAFILARMISRIRPPHSSFLASLLLAGLLLRVRAR